MSELALLGGKPIRTKPFPAYKVIGPEEKEAANRVLDTGTLSRYLGAWHEDFLGGPEIQAFEQEWASYFGSKYAIAVNSCTTGLQCAVGAAGIEPGDEVIVSPFTMAASATVPLWYGAIPVFADIEEKFFCLDPQSIKQRITKRTKAIIVVDIFGQPYDADAINAIAREHGLIVIEDCAQAPGAKYNERYTGTLGDMGVFSLNYHKHIHTGEGGVIVTDNDELADRLRLIRNHAEAVIEAKGITSLVNMLGSNFRLTEFQAAIGRTQLKKLARLIRERQNNCEYLASEIGKLPGISNPGIRPKATHAYYSQLFLYDENVLGAPRDRFIEAVAAELPVTELRETEGKQIGGGYLKPLYLMPIFQQQIAIGSQGYPFKSPFHEPVSYPQGLCPVTEKLHEKTLVEHEYIHPPLTKNDLDDVINAFKKVHQHINDLKQ